MKNAEYKEINMLLKISFICQMVYMLYVFIVNIFRVPVLSIFRQEEIAGKVCVDIAYIAGVLIATVLMFVWYWILKDAIRKNKKLSIAHSVLLGLSVYVIYFKIPNVVYRLQFSYTFRQDYRSDAPYSIASYAVDLFTIEQYGMFLLAGAILFLLSAYVIYWSKCKYEQEATNKNRDSIAINGLMFVSFVFQIFYLGQICLLNIFRVDYLSIYNEDEMVYFDIPFLIGAILITVFMVLWYRFIKEAIKQKKQIHFGHNLLLGISFLMFVYIVPVIANKIQVLLVENVFSMYESGAVYGAKENAVRLGAYETGEHFGLFVAFIFLTCAYVMYWTKMKYSQTQNEV